MSWMYGKCGRASKLAEIVKQGFIDTQGCPAGTAEEAAKNALGEIAETLCKGFSGDPVVKIVASGSAWTVDGKAKQQQCSFTFETLYDFVE